VVQLRRASPRDFKVRFGEIFLHTGKPVSLRPRRQGAKETVEILEWVARRGRRRMARSEGDASPQRAATTERRRQLPFCLAPATVALILALAGVARWAEIAADIGAALRALANAKIHSNATHSSISTVS